MRVVPVFFPRGVADPHRPIAVIRSPTGGIDALDLQDGKRIWHSDDADDPKIVIDRVVMAQDQSTEAPNVLELVELDLATGKPKRTHRITFPRWVQITPADKDEFSYTVQAEDNVLIIEWEAHARYKGGAPPPKHVLDKVRKDAGGVVKIDLHTGDVEMIEQGKEAGHEPFPGEAKKADDTPERPCIVHGRAYSIARSTSGEPTLDARDPESGDLLWRWPLGSTRSRQPPPLPR